MENRLGNSNGAGIPKKSRSLDLKTLYKSSVAKESLNKGLKRKDCLVASDDQQQKQDKKSRKVVSLSSFEKVDNISGKDSENASNGGLGLHELKESKAGCGQKLSNENGFHGISVGLDGSLIHIPKRKRGFTGRNKFENSQALKPAEISRDAVDTVDQISKTAGEESAVQDRLSKVRQKKGSDCSKGKRESDSALQLKEEYRRANHSAANNGELGVKKSESKRKRKALASGGKSLEKGDEPSVDTSYRVSDGSPEDDEENLEANAARMLSSRFDPSCTGFSLDDEASLSPSIDRLPSLSSSGQNSTFPRSKASRLKSSSADADDRVLRPRKNHREKGATRKRRHFYELLYADVDSLWLLNKRIKVFWPLDESWYYGLVDNYDEERKAHHVKYDDRDEEWINLQSERFKILLLPSEVPGKTPRKRRRTGNKSSHKTKGNVKSSKAEEKGNLTAEDDSSTGNLESEPIISWLARSTHRVKSTALGAVKKQKTASILPSRETVKADGSVVGDSMACDKMRKSIGSVLSSGFIGCWDGDESALKTSACPKDSKLPIVYVRRRFHRTRKAMCNVSRGSNTGASKQHDGLRSLDPDLGFWPIDGSGISMLSLPWKECKQVGFDLSFPVISVLNYSFLAEPVWLLHAALLLHHGTMKPVWPRVCLEMIFLDNLVGLRYLLFEGCLMEAVEVVFQVLTVFHQSDEQGEYADLELPVSSIGFRLSCIQDLRVHLAFALYHFCKVRNSKWTYLDRKLRRHSLLTRQLPLSECTYDNIKALQSGKSLSTSVSAGSRSNEGTQRRSRHDINQMRITREASCIKAWPSSMSDKKPRVVPPFALSFAAAPTFFLSLHLKMIMDHSNPRINLPSHDSVEHLETSSSLIVDDSSKMEHCTSKVDKGAPESNLRALQEDANCHGCLSSTEAELRTDNISSSGVGNHIKSPQKSQNDCLDTVCSSPQEPEATKGRAAAPKWQCQQSESEKCSFSSSPSMDRSTTDAGSNRPVNGISIEIPLFDHCENNGDREVRANTQRTDLILNVQGGIIPSPNPTAPRSTWHRSRTSSSSFGFLSHGWSDANGDFLHTNFGNGPKKPRTQVSYSLPSGGFDNGSRNKGHFQKALPHKRIRRSNDRKSADVSRGPQKDLESLSCHANVLVTLGDRGWRECDAQIVLEQFDPNGWKLAIKVSGTTRYSYKAHQFLQPGSTNRFTHAMMWKGGKDWILEFPDRSQWTLFKEMHEECYNRNFRAASVRNIPIPGVHLIEENDDNGTEVVFARSSSKYLRQIENDVEMALDPSRVMYDMDSDDEKWLLKICKCSEVKNSGLTGINEDMFEKAIDMFEKAAYLHQRDLFTSDEIENLMAGAGPWQVVERIYEYWRTKRQRKGMPLIRHLQPPLWQSYQQQVREWELAISKTNTSSANGSQGRGAPMEKPAMFAFCLKPRGLEVPNKGSKHRSQKKLSVYVQNNAAAADHEGLYTSAGRRSSGFAYGDEKFLYSGHNYEYLDDSPLHQTSPRVFSPHDSGMGFSASNGYGRNHQYKFQRSKSKKIGVFSSTSDPRIGTSYNQKVMMGRRNETDQWNMGYAESLSPHFYLSNAPHRLNPEELDSSVLDEFRLRVAAGKAKHAQNVAKLKRQRAERLHYVADIAIQKAAVALMTAEAIKASASEDSGNG